MKLAVAWCAALIGAAVLGAGARAQPVVPLEVAPLPFGAKRLPASADECAVWQREQAFAQSVERHDAAAFASHLHPGAIFNAGSAEADRGRETVVKEWNEIVEGKTIALRWRAGIVQIGSGEARVALSRGPYILQRLPASGAAGYRVGLYQTVWVRDPGEGAWRVLFDGSASSSQPVEDRAAADRWVEAQPMSDCSH